MITELYVLGPFLAGVREPFVDFLYPKGEEYYSVFSAEPLRWRPLKFFGDSFKVEWDASEIKKLSEYQGVSASLAVYYVKGKIKADSGVYLVRFTNVLWVEINGKRYIMDIYNDGLFVPVPLRAENELFMAISALGGERTVKFEIKKAPQEPYIVENDITKPDLIVGENFVGYVGIPVANPTKDGVWITLNNRKYFLEGFQVLKVPVLISIKAPNSKGRVVIPINFMGKRYEIPLEVKGEDEVIRRTFISGMDSSVQYYAVRYPKGYNPNKKYALILSLHGAGVEAFNQCRSHKQKDWAFVVCPTNRRRFGFDWEDFGRIDALEVLSEALKNYPIDRNKIYLTGHSMGGHGTWHLCTSYPSIWTACLPMAGWTSVKFYLSTHLQRAKLFPESEFTHLRERIFQQSEPYKLVENLLNLPVVVLHGGDDEVVPPFHSRLMADIMSRYGVKFKYIEVPKKGHWWDGVLDHEEAWRALLSLKVNRKEKVFVTFSLDVSDSAFGVRILEVERPFEKAKFTINYDRVANIKTENIKALVLTNFRGDVTIDGTRIRNYKGEILVKGKVWEKAERYNYSRPVLIRETFYSPFLIVYSSSELWTKDFAVYMANMWWMYANGKAQVIPDTMLNYFPGNYNLVIIGSKLKLPAQIADEFLKVEENSVSVRKTERLLLFYKISDEGLIRLAMSMVPYITRSVAVMPSYIKLSYDAYLMGWSGLKGGILSFPPR
jgi:pimeloyl-ACP methyl ester carboxylesterase